ncbi:MAG: hypothetical protein KKA42_09055 [candidate division Zixibacteria bacterium]|nr:hypothetical protein [candidate division Zixibacteria bacterium]
MNLWSAEYSFEVDLKQGVIFEKIYGIWKKTTAEDYHRDFVEAVQPLIAQPWAKLVDLAGWRTSYPDVVKVVGSHLRWCRDNNMALSINVLNNVSTFRQLNEMFSGGGTGALSKTFRTREEAEKFLKENWVNRTVRKSDVTR